MAFRFGGGSRGYSAKTFCSSGVKSLCEIAQRIASLVCLYFLTQGPCGRRLIRIWGACDARDLCL